MKHKTWFRLVLKAIGVMLVAFAIPGIVSGLIMIIDASIRGEQWTLASPYSNVISGGYMSRVLLVAAVQSVPALTQLAIGLYLFFDGAWIINKAIPSNRPYCHDCGYDLSQSHNTRCPECGAATEAREPSAQQQ